MSLKIDLIHNGRAEGDVADRLINSGGDVRVLRPFIGRDGRHYVTANSGRYDAKGDPIVEARLTTNGATLRKDDWLRLDTVLLREKRQKLRAWADLRAANTYGGFDGFSTLMLENELVDDVGEAHVDFDGLTEGRGASPTFGLDGLPLPIIHAPFSFSARKIAVSRQGGQPISTTQAEHSTRRVMETVERMTIGTLLTSSYLPENLTEYRRAPRIWGYTTHPDRMTSTITAPTATGWKPETLVNEILDITSGLQDNGFDGPFMVYHGRGWTKHLGSDYSDQKGSNTLSERIKKIEDVQDLRRLNYMGDAYRILVIQMTPDVAEAVNGMEFSMIQWDTKGGMQKNFRVMGIQVPRIRSTLQGRCGICDATTA